MKCSITICCCRYQDGYHYQNSFRPLIKLEADYDKKLALMEKTVKEYKGLYNASIEDYTKARARVDSSVKVTLIGSKQIINPGAV